MKIRLLDGGNKMDEYLFKQQLQEKNIILNDEQVEQFQLYYKLLVEWNEKVNLTAITEKNDVYLKHFFDSITPSFFIDFTKDLSICDVGAGAGFPTIPLKICFPQLKITIVDSLKKRIDFLQLLVDQLNLKNITLIHARAEDFGINKKYREQFDFVTARAVARMSVLSELCLPLTKVNGQFIALKGSNVSDELKDGEKAIKTLGGQIKDNITFSLPIEESGRSIVVIDKIKQTPRKYPRKAGTPARNPIK